MRRRCAGAVRCAPVEPRLVAPRHGPTARARPFPAFVEGLKIEALSRGVSAAVRRARAHRPRAEPHRDRARSDAGGDRAHGRSVRCSRRLTRPFVRTARPDDDEASERCCARVSDDVRRAAARHRRDLGARVELRPVQRRAADDSGAGDAGVGRAARRVLPRRAAWMRWRSSTAATSSSNAARLVGRRDGADAVHAIELSQVGRRSSTRTAIATSGARSRTSSRRSPTTSASTSGRRVARGAARCGCPSGGIEALRENAGMRTEGCRAEREMTVALPLAKWQALGVRTVERHGAAQGGRRGLAHRHRQARVSRLRQLRVVARVQLRPFLCAGRGSAV